MAAPEVGQFMDRRHSARFQQSFHSTILRPMTADTEIHPRRVRLRIHCCGSCASLFLDAPGGSGRSLVSAQAGLLEGASLRVSTPPHPCYESHANLAGLAALAL